MARRTSLVQRRHLATSRGEHAWRTQRPANDWAGFLGHFREVVALARERAHLLASVTGLSPYDALLDQFEPGMTGARLDQLFGQTVRWLPGLVTRALRRQRDEVVLQPVGPFDLAAQQRLCERVMATLGFDFGAGRIWRLSASVKPQARGAIDEMMAASAYTQLAGYTKNQELAKLLLRMAKDERRHQSFYYHQAEQRMQTALGRGLAKFALHTFWSPVGIGVGGDDDELAFIGWMLYDNERGAEDLRHMDRMMARLPGMEGCNLAYRNVMDRMKSFRQRRPQELDRLRSLPDSRDRSAPFRAPVAEMV